MIIDGQTFAGMIVSAANALDNNKTAINNMNVFPVPDGDTGINMTLTMSTVRALYNFNGTISDCADRMASLILRSARGNSGAILSLFFRGMAKSLKGLDTADSKAIAAAFMRGTEEAYKAVMNPTEGTILTVMRICSEKAVEAAEDKYSDDVVGLFTYLLSVAEDALAKTPEQLPLLKEVNVVDAGGYGFVLVLSGMLDALNFNPVVAHHAGETLGAVEADFSEFCDSDIKFAYCTECIVEKKPELFGEGSAAALKEFICSMGDSAVFVDDEKLIKLHVHTNHPGLVIEKALEFGAIDTMKVENMRRQHSEMSADSKNKQKRTGALPPEKKYGFVAVCMGEGIKDTFADLGADRIVYGGQTMNPSTQDIVDGVNLTPAEIVYVLPNNKNIYLVAKEAAKLVKDKSVIVLNTVSAPQGISAMLAFDESADAQANTEAMEQARSKVISLSTTYAVRDTKIDGREIHEGQILGLADGSIYCVGDSNSDCIMKLADKMKGASFITVFYGDGVRSEDADAVCEMLRGEVPEAEFTLLYGGQPLYDYIISAE